MSALDKYLYSARPATHSGMRETTVTTPRGMRERRRPTLVAGRMTVRGYEGHMDDGSDKVPFAVVVWNRRQRKQHQYTPRAPAELVMPEDADRLVSQRELNWSKHMHQDLKTCTATEKITSLPPPEERVPDAGPGRIPHLGGSADGSAAKGGTRLVSQRQLQREKMAHINELHGKRYELR
jgi:hypothetical protein